MSMRTAGLDIGHIGFGCLQLETLPDDIAVKMIVDAYKLGVRMFDTAAAYGTDRHNEKLLSKAIKEIRHEYGEKTNILFSTKCGINFSTMGYEASREQILESVKRSLQELNVDVIPLLYLHRLNPESSEDELKKTFEALRELAEDGRVQYIGLSEPSATQIEIADVVFKNTTLPYNPFMFVQSACSIATQRSFKNGVFKACQDRGIQFVSYTSVVRGLIDARLFEALSLEELAFLTPEDIIDKIKVKLEIPESDFRFFVGFFERSVIKTNIECILRFQSLAKNWNINSSKLALAWQVSKGLLPIPGTSNLEHLRSNVEAASIILSAEQIEALDDCFASFKGNPNPPKMLDNEALEI